MQTESSRKRHVRVERGVYRRSTVDGTRYEYCYSDEIGKTRWATTRTLKEARDGRAAKIAAVARGEHAVAPTKITFAEWAETWFDLKKNKLRPSTVTGYRRALDVILLPRFGSWRLAKIDADAISALIRALHEEGLHAVDHSRPIRPLRRSAIVNYMKPLSGPLRLAVRRGHIVANPFHVLTSDDWPPQEERTIHHEWSDADVDALLAAATALATRRSVANDYTSLLRVVARLGLRLGEALGLRWEDFDREAGYLHVRRQWTCTGEYGPTKTKAGVRRIALPEDLREELIALRLRSRPSADDSPIFVSTIGKPHDHRTVSRWGFQRARDLAELPPHLTFHSLRHAAASRMIRAGLDPVTVASVLGHENANMTLAVYAHLFDRRRTDDSVRLALAGDLEVGLG
jgi:integrase